MKVKFIEIKKGATNTMFPVAIKRQKREIIPWVWVNEEKTPD